MEGLRLGTAVVLIVVLASCAGGKGPVSDPSDSVPEPEPVTAPPGFENVPAFYDEEVRMYAAEAELAGDAGDENAEPWSQLGVAGSYDSIDGEWDSRWNATPPNEDWHPGTATIRSVGDRVFIRFEGEYEYWVEAIRQDDRLIGRYVAVSDERVTLPWVGRVVSNERIDGIWALGRWDFRRGGRVEPGDTGSE